MFHQSPVYHRLQQPPQSEQTLKESKSYTLLTDCPEILYGNASVKVNFLCGMQNSKIGKLGAIGLKRHINLLATDFFLKF